MMRGVRFRKGNGNPDGRGVGNLKNNSKNKAKAKCDSGTGIVKADRTRIRWQVAYDRK